MFERLMLIQLGDKVNVEINAFKDWLNAKQKSNQTIRAYAASLDQVPTHVSHGAAGEKLSAYRAVAEEGGAKQSCL